MARHRVHDHLLKSETPTGVFGVDGDGAPSRERTKYTAWCGETRSGHVGYLPPHLVRDSARPCPKCQSKKLAAKIKAEPIPFKLADRVDLSGDDNPYGLSRWGFKSVYPVIDTRVLADDERDRVVAFVTIDSGWGKQWEIHPWEMPYHRGDPSRLPEPTCSTSGVITFTTPTVISPAIPGTSIKELKTGGYKRDARRLVSKEEALLLIPLMDEQGLLKTRQGIFAQMRENRAREDAAQLLRDQEAAERQKRRDREREEQQRTRDGLLADIREVLHSGGLSNFARDVMFRTARAAGFGEDDLTASPTNGKTDDFDPKEM